MRSSTISQRKKIGLPPGAMVFVGEQKTDLVKLRLVSYGPEQIAVTDAARPDELLNKLQPGQINWINLWGLHDPSVLENLGRHFKLHPLVMEDILNTSSRPKIDIHDDYIFIVMKTLNYVVNEHNCHLESSQFSMIVGKDYLITCQEKSTGLLKPILERLENGRTHIREGGSDYLAYAIIDIIVDYYFLVLENLEEQIDKLEDRALSPERDHISTDLHQLKRELLQMRKAVWPLREIINLLQVDLFKTGTGPYVRDLHDHILQIMDTVENYRDMLEGVHDIYFASVGLRMNDIMKTLAIISTIFIPLTFLAGVYGMNFEHMPELKTTWGYPTLWGIFITIVLVMLYYFRKRKWL